VPIEVYAEGWLDFTTNIAAEGAHHDVRKAGVDGRLSNPVSSSRGEAVRAVAWYRRAAGSGKLRGELP